MSMKFLLFKKIKLYWLTILLIILLLYSLFIQNFFLSQFDLAKQAVSRWPMLSKPHLLMAQAFFNDGSEKCFQELETAKQSWLKNQKIIIETEKLISQPEKINQEIAFWQEKINEGLQNPAVYLTLASLNYQIDNIEKAREYWQKAFYLDPNNQEVEKIKKLINQ
jgi:tetratricopeptide (TPR) repeat protein